MCARHGRGAIEICLSEKGALAKKRLGNTVLNYVQVREGESRSSYGPAYYPRPDYHGALF